MLVRNTQYIPNRMGFVKSAGITKSGDVCYNNAWMLQQNDFIITQNTGYRNFQQSFSQFGTILSIVSTLSGLTATYFAVRTYQNATK